MSMVDTVTAPLERAVGRVARRGAAWLAVAIFGVVVVCEVTVALHRYVALSQGAVTADLAVAGLYALLGLVTLLVLFWSKGRRAVPKAPPPVADPAPTLAALINAPRELQIAMILEAIALGYALSRNRKIK
jgi:hypothetical protein